MSQKAAAGGKWWFTALYNTPAHASRLLQSFLEEHQITQVTQPPTTGGHPDLAPCDLWLFPKLKSPLKGRRFHTVNEIQENRTGQLMVTGELCEAPRCLLWRGLRLPWPRYSVSWIFFNKGLYFSRYRVDTLWTELVYAEVEQLDLMLLLILSSWGTSILVFIVATQVHLPN